MTEEPFPYRHVDLAVLWPFGSLWSSRCSMFGSSWSVFRRHLSCGRTHSTDAHQVVGQTGQAHELFVAPYASQPRLAQAAHRLAPAKELLDAFAHNLTGPVAGRLERAFAQASREVTGIDSHMRGDALGQQRIDEAARVIALVAADTFGSQSLAPLSCYERQRRLGLRHADRLREAHASISVPSTLKCSSESSSRERASRTTASKNFRATSSPASRSRFLLNVEASKDGSSRPMSKNQRNRML